jgi:hypothetical protein
MRFLCQEQYVGIALATLGAIVRWVAPYSHCRRLCAAAFVQDTHVQIVALYKLSCQRVIVDRHN